MTCKNQEFDGPIEYRIGYNDGYANWLTCRAYVTQIERTLYYGGFKAGQQDRIDDDNERLTNLK